MRQKLLRELASVAGTDHVRENEPMRLHTTFRIGGPADLFITLKDPRKAGPVMELLRGCGVPVFVLGNGSNVLVSDDGFRGAVIRMAGSASDIRVSDGVIRAPAGVLLSSVAAAALHHSLTGLEFASGIPGTVGGACVMNAGAYGGEMRDVLTHVTVLDENFEIRRMPADQLGLGYRTSRIQDLPWTVLEAECCLEKGEESAILSRMNELKEKRTAKQPLEFPSAGSTFKRPEGFFAGKLIEEAGLRGFSCGGAQVSEKHCGFVISRKDATAADVLGVIREVQRRVAENAGVLLEPEIRMLGFEEE